MFRRLVPVVCLAPLSGCGLLDLLTEEIEIPITIETPPQEFDVGAAIAEAEAAACSDTSSAACTAITTICQSEAGRDCTEPSLPDEFPARVTVPGTDGDSAVDANELIKDAGLDEAAEFELAIPVDTATALKEQGVDSPDLTESVSVEAFAFTWPENSLTFDLPPLEIYVANQAIDEANVDAEALINAGSVTLVGRIGIDEDGDGTFEVGQRAGGTETVPLIFEESGKEAFNAAVLSGTFTIVTAVPSDYQFQLKEKDGTSENPMLLKPSGIGKVGVQASFIFKVKASDVLNLAQAASEE